MPLERRLIFAFVVPVLAVKGMQQWARSLHVDPTLLAVVLFFDDGLDAVTDDQLAVGRRTHLHLRDPCPVGVRRNAIHHKDAERLPQGRDLAVDVRVRRVLILVVDDFGLEDELGVAEVLNQVAWVLALGAE